MDTGQRLAAYLSGDLDPAEREALEAQLDGDPALRARLEQVRAADDALAGLDEVELPEGFEQRLRDRLQPEVAAVVGDELAARRARRAPRWLPAAGAAAAVAALVTGGVLVVGQGSSTSGDDGATTLGAEAAGGDRAETTESAVRGGAFDAGEPPSGPLVVDRGRTVGPEQLTALASLPEVRARLESVQPDPAIAADDYAAALDTTAEAPQDAPGSSSGREALSRATLQSRGPVSDEDLDAVARCLSVLSEDAADPIVPLYAELAETGDGDEVIVYAAASPAADDTYRRIEVWMVDRATCTLRRFVQVDT